MSLFMEAEVGGVFGMFLIGIIITLLGAYFIWIASERVIYWANDQLNFNLKDVRLVHLIVFIGLIVLGFVPGVSFINVVLVIGGFLMWIGAI